MKIYIMESCDCEKKIRIGLIIGYLFIVLKWYILIFFRLLFKEWIDCNV